MTQTLEERIAELQKKLDEALAKVRELEGKQWLPIESAPKDGTWILVYKKSEYLKPDPSDEIFIVQRRTCIVKDEDSQEEKEVWFIEFDDEYCENIYIENPTHWIPLPEAPKLNKQGETHDK